MANQAPERVVNGIKTRVIHQKDYVEVSTRVHILHELRKAGEIKEFEMVESEPHEIAGYAYWRVSARIDGKLYIGDAEIKFDAPKNTPDGTNPISCAETSAFGRMLAFAGLGTVDSIASYDEVARGKPFTQIVEHVSDRVVESSNRRQLPPQTEEDKRKARLNEIFKSGKSKGLFGNKDEMAEYISAGLKMEINPEDIATLDDEHLLVIEQDIETAQGLAEAS